PQADGTSAAKQPPATESAAAVQGGGDGGPGVDVIMPQMGESIFEGTITKWLKKPGDKVQRDEPLFEISTDKVDAEIPAPSSGILREIKVPEGSTVQVNSVVPVIGDGAGAPAAKPAAPAPAARPTEKAPRKAEPAAVAPSAPAERSHEVISFPAGGREEQVEGERIRSSPLVRRIARENNVDLAAVSGTGLGGRITKDDIMNFVQQHGPGAAARPSRPAAPQPVARPAAPQPVAQPRPVVAAAQPAVVPQLAGELVPMTPMRKKIAE